LEGPSPIKLWVRIPSRRGVLDTTSCDKVCQQLPQVSGFLRLPRFPPPINWSPWYNWNIVESRVKYHQANKQTNWTLIASSITSIIFWTGPPNVTDSYGYLFNYSVFRVITTLHYWMVSRCCWYFSQTFCNVTTLYMRFIYKCHRRHNLEFF
jgi:hypothetical protein